MPKFNYVAMDSNGKETKGSLDVASQNEAITRLKDRDSLSPAPVVARLVAVLCCTKILTVPEWR